MTDILEKIVDHFDNFETSLKYSSACLSLINHISDLNEKEIEVVNGFNSGFKDNDREILLDDFYALSKSPNPHESGRARIFFGLLAKDEIVTAYSGEILALFARSAGFSDREIESAFGLPNSA